MFLKISQNSHGKHLCQSLLFKKRLWHKCFPMNFVKFLRTPFFTEHLWWLLVFYMDYDQHFLLAILHSLVPSGIISIISNDNFDNIKRKGPAIDACGTHDFHWFNYLKENWFELVGFSKIAMDKFRRFKGGNGQVLIFCWLLLPLLQKIYAATFKVNMTNHSQVTAKKQFHRCWRYHHIHKLYWTINALK